METAFLIFDPQTGVRGIFHTRQSAELAIMKNLKLADEWRIAEVPIGTVFSPVWSYFDSEESSPSPSPRLRSISSPPMFAFSLSSPPTLSLESNTLFNLRKASSLSSPEN